MFYYQGVMDYISKNEIYIKRFEANIELQLEIHQLIEKLQKILIMTSFPISLNT